MEVCTLRAREFVLIQSRARDRGHLFCFIQCNPAEWDLGINTLTSGFSVLPISFSCCWPNQNNSQKIWKHTGQP